MQHQHRTNAQISAVTATVFPGECSSVWNTVGTVLAVWFGSTHCGSWVLAPCQAKQNLIPSAGKARPPLSNPILSSLVVWSAHTAVPPYISPLGWKKMLLVGMRQPALFMGLYDTQTAIAKKKKKINDHKVTTDRTQKQTSNLAACMYLFSVDDHRWLRYLRQHFPASLPQSVNIKAAAFYLWSSAPVPSYP